MQNSNKRPVGNTGNVLLPFFVFQRILCSVCSNTDSLDNVFCKKVLLELYSSIFLCTPGNRSSIFLIAQAISLHIFWNSCIPERRVDEYVVPVV